MAKTLPGPGKGIPWELRLGMALHLSPLAHGLLTALFLISFFHAVHWLLGSWPWVHDPETGLPIESNARLAIVAAILIGFASGGSRSLGLFAFRVRQNLGFEEPTIDVSREEGRAHELPPGALRTARRSGMFAACLTLALIGLTVWLLPLSDEPTTTADLVWSVAVLPLLFSTGARMISFSAYGSRRITDAVEQNLEIDLLNLRPLYQIGRLALRGALYWIIAISVLAFLFLSRDLVLPIATLMAITLGTAAFSFLVPVRGIRAKVARAKHAELEAIEARLRKAREATLKGEPGGEGRLSDLLSYRTYLEDLSEWPFDTPTLIRIGLYLLIPLGSWFGGALVERLVSAALD